MRMSSPIKPSYPRIGSTFLFVLGLLVLLFVQGNSGLNASMTPFPAKVRHTLYPNEWGVAHPAGLAYANSSGHLFVLDKRNSNAAHATLTMITAYEELVAKVQIPFPIDNAINIAYDETGNRLFLLDGKNSRLAQMSLDAQGRPDPATVQRTNMPQPQITNPQGMATDQIRQRLLILDSDAQRIDILDLNALPSSANRTGSIDLSGLGATTLRGLAIHPATQHLVVGDLANHLLYEITQAGALVAHYTTDALGLADAQGFVFAPSADLTDSPTTFHLFTADSYLTDPQAVASGLAEEEVADRIYLPLISMQPASSADNSGTGNSGTGNSGQLVETAASSAQQQMGQIVEIALDASEQLVTAAAGPPVVLSLVQTVDTAAFSPSSPDPAGVVYIPTLDQLLISDSEVNEIPALFTGANLFASTVSGSLQRTGTTTAYSMEPTGLAYNATSGNLFVSDDNAREVFEIVAGADGLFGTGDDQVTSFDTQVFNSMDPEGVTFNNNTGELFIVDGINKEVYKVNPGPNGLFDGIPAAGGDDIVTSFDVMTINIFDPEGIHYDASSDHLFLVGNNRERIYEITTNGALIELYDTAAAAIRKNAGITIAPASTNSQSSSFYIVDRRIDNDADPNENDGKMYEFLFNSGNNTVVPTVVGLPQAQAEQAITGVGLAVGTITQQSSNTVPAGTVISQSPSAGASVAPGSAVDLVISAGASTVTVPNVVGLSQAQAQQAITNASLAVGTITQQSSSTVPAGTVISQSPSAGASVAPSSAVDLVISTGPPGGATSTVTVYSSQDTYVKEKERTKNFGDKTKLEVKSKSGDQKQALYQFDLSPVPLDATVQSATVRLYVEKESNNPVFLHRITSPWTEYGATWSNAANIFDATPVTSFTPGQKGQMTIDITGLVQQWVNGSAANHGFMLVASNDKESKYFSREEGNADKLPVLDVTFVSSTVTQEFSVAQDTYVNEKDKSKNFGDIVKLELKKKSNETRQALVRFDLSSVPASATVTLATVGFWVENDSPDPVKLHRITGPWSEYSATWNNSASAYAATPVALVVPSPKDQLIMLDITTLVQQWVDGSVANHGFMLLAGSDEDAKFHSKEKNDSVLRPFLQIAYRQ